MAILTSKNTFRYATPIASKTLDRASAVALLQDHARFMRSNPHFVGYEAAAPTAADEAAAAREAKAALPGRPPRAFEVKHHVPNPVYSADIVSREVYVDCADGIWTRTESPMGVVLETQWCVRERTPDGDGDGDDDAATLEFVQEGHFTCSKVLSGVVRRQTDASIPDLHRSVIQAMEQTAVAA